MADLGDEFPDLLVGGPSDDPDALDATPDLSDAVEEDDDFGETWEGGEN